MTFTMKKKPTLYALHTTKSVISANNGDVINEIRNMGTLSSVFDVYYNNDIYDPQKKQLGIKDQLGPSREYDFYYIRNNPDVFKSIRGKKIIMAYPYDEDMFKSASAVFVQTPNWKNHLQKNGIDSEEKLKYLYKSLTPSYEGLPYDFKCPVINTWQRTDQDIVDKVSTKKDLFKFEAETTGAKVFGYYGNLSKNLYPYMGFAAIKNLHRDFPEHSPTVILAGRFRKGGEIADKNIIHIGNVDYDDMPSLIDVSTATFTTESLLCNTLGNQKVLDSISRGVPVLCRKLDTFVSQLGDNYPCFYESENEAYDLAKNLLMDKDFSEDVRKFCLERSKYHSQNEVIKRFLDQPELKSLLES